MYNISLIFFKIEYSQSYELQWCLLFKGIRSKTKKNAGPTTDHTQYPDSTDHLVQCSLFNNVSSKILQSR